MMPALAVLLIALVVSAPARDDFALPEGNIIVSDDQFATAVSDADIFPRIGELAGMGRELEELVLDESSVVGGGTELARAFTATPPALDSRR